MQAYSDPTREQDEHALPDLEVFELTAGQMYADREHALEIYEDEPEHLEAGWYWWSCFPGCMPDSEAMGPFNTEAEALADAQNS